MLAYLQKHHPILTKISLYFLGLQSLVRLVLCAVSLNHHDLSWEPWSLVVIMIKGLGYDFIVLSYIWCAGLILSPWHLKSRPRIRHWIQRLGIILFLAFAIFTAAAEYFFFEEFTTRFNFITVDYLIYTQEIIQNAVESYPIFWIFLAIFTLTIGLAWPLLKISGPSSSNRTSRFCHLIVALGIATGSYAVIDNKDHKGKEPIKDELSYNGYYQFVSAFFHNKLDYNKFYATIPQDQALKITQESLQSPQSTWTDPAKNIRRKIKSNPQKPTLNTNLIFILSESMSASFMGRYGNTQGLTPFLDGLAQKSLVFDKLFATGTRTVRGMEATTLAVPPTPGASIVRRDKIKDLFSLASPFRNKGYKLKFIYGGYGAFDNMNTFMRAQGFDIVDRTDIPKSEIVFANAWGVSDDDLFKEVIKQADQDTKAGHKFLYFVLLTSNHRPYTYPSGRIDPSWGKNREAVVRYTDAAYEKFFQDAAHKPWFNQSIFALIADHCAKASGKTYVPMSSFHIMGMIHAPQFVPARAITNPVSQIDIIPTLMGILNWDYTSQFMGQDVLARLKENPSYESPIFFGTYENMAYYQQHQIISLGPKKLIQAFQTQNEGLPNFQQTPIHDINPEIKNKAIALYQTASMLYEQGLMHDAQVQP